MGANNVSLHAVNFQHINPSNKCQCWTGLAQTRTAISTRIVTISCQLIWRQKIKETDTDTKKPPWLETFRQQSRMGGQNEYLKGFIMWSADLNKGSSTSNMRRLEVNTKVAQRCFENYANRMPTNVRCKQFVQRFSWWIPDLVGR